jgi:hypothetical protein
MKNYTLILIALLSFSSACNNNFNINNKSDNIKIVSFNEGPNTTGTLKEGPNTTGTLKEGPNTTGTLKEGPNTTGTLKEGPNTTGSLKLTEKFILLTRQGIDYNSPVTPESIKDIDIIYLKSKISLKARNIRLKGQDNFNIMSESEYVAAEYDGNGGFKFKIRSTEEDMIVKFVMIDGTKLTIPLINNENNINAVITKENNNTLVKAKSYNTDQAYLIKNDINNQQFIISIDKNNNKEYYLAEDLENKVSNGFKKYDLGQIKANLNEKTSIISDIKNISPISAFIGSWTYKFKDYRLYLNIFDQGNSKFLWILSLNNVIYQGYGNYVKDAKNDSIKIYALYEDKILSLKINSKESNILNIISESNSDNKQILDNLNINLVRAII